MRRTSSNHSDAHEMKDPLQILDQLGRVDAPPFLLTRILQRVRQEKELRVRPAVAWALGLSLMGLLAFNISVIRSAEKKEARQTYGYLLPQNNLYR